MIEIKRLAEYDEKLAADMGRLLKDLDAAATGAPISREWMEEVIESRWHDQLLAYDGEDLVGMATVSVVMSAFGGRVEYLEDLVVSKERQGQGIGSVLWEAIVAWGREKGAKKLEFTSSGKDLKAGAVEFYLGKGAEIRETNNFRFKLGE